MNLRNNCKAMSIRYAVIMIECLLNRIFSKNSNGENRQRTNLLKHPAG